MKHYLREGRAMATQLSLLLSDRGETFSSGAEPIVFFLHGLYATAGQFRPLRNSVALTLGLSHAALNHAPGVGIAELAERAATWVTRAAAGRSYFLVGHSLGALAFAWAGDQGHLPAGRRGGLYLAPPLFGARQPQLALGQAGQDLASDSAVLQKLRSCQAAANDTWVYAAEDQLIVPPPSLFQLDESEPKFSRTGRRELVFSGVGHNGILFDPRTQALLLRCLDNAYSTSQK